MTSARLFILVTWSQCQIGEWLLKSPRLHMGAGERADPSVMNSQQTPSECLRKPGSLPFSSAWKRGRGNRLRGDMTCPGQPGQEVVKAGCDLGPTRGRAHFDARSTHFSFPGRSWAGLGYPGFLGTPACASGAGPGVGWAGFLTGSGKDPPGLRGGGGLTGFPVRGRLDSLWEEPRPGPMEGEA